MARKSKKKPTPAKMAALVVAGAALGLLYAVFLPPLGIVVVLGFLLVSVALWAFRA